MWRMDDDRVEPEIEPEEAEEAEELEALDVDEDPDGEPDDDDLEPLDDDLEPGDGEDGPFELAGTEDIDPTSARPLAMSGEGFLTYEVSEWSGESRSLLDSMLTSAGILHFWQGTALSVEEEAEERVDRIIDEVLASATASLDDDRDKCVYEVAEWSAAMQQSLADSLAVAEIAYEWDERGDLVVYADDEDAVDRIIDAMPDPEDADRHETAEVDVQAALSELWTAAGQLAKNPANPSAIVTTADLADTLEHAPLPFGFEPAVWRSIVEQATGLRDGLTSVDDGAWEDDEVIEVAGTLRDVIRPFV